VSRAADRRVLLERLYGEGHEAVAADVEALIAEQPGTPRPSGAPWDERDLWLITYADQFQSPGEAPLRTMERFLEASLRWVNGVHILPFAPWSSDDGFSVTDYHGVDQHYGTWEDIGRIAASRRLMVDAVINHMSAESQWFRGFLAGDSEYDGLFRTADPAADLSATVRPRTTPLLTPFERQTDTAWVWTTFSADQVDLDYRNPATLLRILDVILGYARRGAAVIRLDAIAFLWKEEGTTSLHLPQTHDVIRLIRAVLDDSYPDVLIVTETNVPHTENVSYFGDGTMPEAQIVYQFPLAPLVLHAAASGDVVPLATWASDLGDPPPGTTFLNFLASHDGVGIRPAEGILTAAQIDDLAAQSRRGGGDVGMRSMPDGAAAPYELNSTWFDLVGAGRPEDEAIELHLATHAAMLALRGIPALYVHSLFGTANDTDLFAATGRARSLNRRKFTDTAALDRALARQATRTHRVAVGIERMARARTYQRAFHPAADQRILQAPAGVLAVERIAPDGARARVDVNFTDRAVEVDPGPGPWIPLYGGADEVVGPRSSRWLAGV
jgi:sucrose phosphorylase